MDASSEWSDDLGELRGFAMALVDGHHEVSRDALVERLIKQAGFARIAFAQGDARGAKTRIFREFIALYRRYLRKNAFATDAQRAEAPQDPTLAAVRALPLEMREPLLLTALSGFTHSEVAQTLDLPLPRLVDRLREARQRLADALDPATKNSGARAGHLRLVK
jgi:hypothetical protein